MHLSRETTGNNMIDPSRVQKDRSCKARRSRRRILLDGSISCQNVANCKAKQTYKSQRLHGRER